MVTNNFRRIEQKYLLTEIEYQKIKDLIKIHCEKNEYYFSEIRNIYYDNDNNDIINNCYSYYKYRCKYRIRSYKEITSEDDLIFAEIKTKLNDIGYKRRAVITYKEYKEFISKRILPKNYSQIMKEIQFYIESRYLKPYMYIAYNRISFYEKENPDLRITFDSNLRYRLENLELRDSFNDKKYFDSNIYIMEIKSNTGLPIWLNEYLTENKLYKTAFSKMKKIYEKECNEKCLKVY